MSAFVFYGTQRDPQYKLPLYGQEKHTAEFLDWTMGFEDVLWVNFDHFFSFERSNFKKSSINNNGGKCLVNGKGSTVTFTSPRLQVRTLWSNHAPDHHGVLSSY